MSRTTLTGTIPVDARMPDSVEAVRAQPMPPVFMSPQASKRRSPSLHIFPTDEEFAGLMQKFASAQPFDPTMVVPSIAGYQTLYRGVPSNPDLGSVVPRMARNMFGQHVPRSKIERFMSSRVGYTTPLLKQKHGDDDPNSPKLSATKNPMVAAHFAGRYGYVIEMVVPPPAAPPNLNNRYPNEQEVLLGSFPFQAVTRVFKVQNAYPPP